MCIDLIELKPYNTVNRLFLSYIFQHNIRRFDGYIRSNTFPVFIVQGNTEDKTEDRCWKEVRLFLTKIDFELIKKLSKEVNDWYINFKSGLQAKIQDYLRKISKDNLLSHDIKDLDLLCIK